MISFAVIAKRIPAITNAAPAKERAAVAGW